VRDKILPEQKQALIELVPIVAQICNLLYRRIAFGHALNGVGRWFGVVWDDSSAIIAATCCRLKICDTAECNSALHLLHMSARGWKIFVSYPFESQKPVLP
jgi:hypothetical protein